jgi:G:T-mismatch repair DNA endonuclease (very short patch repair protein)
MLLHRLRDAGFPVKQIELNVAHSHGSFVADHLAPLSALPAARAAYWAPTDALLAGLGSADTSES